MRTLERTTAFKGDYRRERAGNLGKRLDALLGEVLTLLANDSPLPPARRDHALAGEWSDCRECHLRPDLLLVYRKPDPATLQLVRLGSHSELFG